MVENTQREKHNKRVGLIVVQEQSEVLPLGAECADESCEQPPDTRISVERSISEKKDQMQVFMSANNSLDDSNTKNGSTFISADHVKIGNAIPEPILEKNSESKDLGIALKNADFVVVGQLKVRKNGFQQPFGIFQVLSWIIALFLLGSFTVTVSTLLNQDGTDEYEFGCVIISAIYFVCFLAMVLTTIIVTRSDPTDPTIAMERLAQLSKLKKLGPQYKFDESSFQFHCDICDTHVLKNTKHCQRCNRCCYEFDHHCVWVSNDIGLHNYADFMRMLISVFATNIT